ncbi:MAG TPA: DedA family protein [Acidimicrobiales bacterium]|nr:DedA family protein [Acidimicrobiales bacterium]
MDPRPLIEAFGTIGILVIVFAESGILAGFFLPGDSLLFTAGLLASQGHLNLAALAIGCPLAAIAGDQVGYVFGNRVGPALFRRPDSRFFKRRHLERARGYFNRYGARTVIVARFIPVVRTFTPVLAGVVEMPYRTFVTCNVIGGIVWGSGVVLLGWGLGQAVPEGEKWLLPVVAVVIFVSFIPVAREMLKLRREGAADRLVEAHQLEGDQ